MENSLVAKNELWLDRKNKIISFHFVSDFVYKRFGSYLEFLNYVVWRSQSGYKFQ